MALEAPVEGRIALQLLKIKARCETVNCKTVLAGSVRAEVLDLANQPLPDPVSPRTIGFLTTTWNIR